MLNIKMTETGSIVTIPGHKGRGASSNFAGRFERFTHGLVDDGWSSLEEVLTQPPPATELFEDKSRTVIARNQSPDIPFDQSINPYRGCEHGCIYCYARPSHAFGGLSSGIDFETKIFAKYDAPELLSRELAKKSYVCKPIAMGANTDPYQPVERRLRLTRRILEILHKHNHPMGIVTKSNLVMRDIDLLADMAKRGLARVSVSITTFDRTLARKLEPRAPTPERRLEAVEKLVQAGIPTGVMAAPMIPALNDHELETILKRAAEAGAVDAGYTLLRLPYDVKDLFEEWLDRHYKLKRQHVLSLLREARDGRLNDPEFGSRMRGKGHYATLLARRFQRATKKLGLNRKRMPNRTDLFRPPSDGDQFDMFDLGEAV